MTSVSGIVLAGGASRRFGSDKLIEPIDGISLLERAIRALDGIVDEVVVVTAPDRPPSGQAVARAGPPIRWVQDAEALGGPLAGLATGLQAATGATVLVVGGDMPYLVPAVLRRLIGGPPAALADASGTLRPLPCALDRTSALLAADELLAGGERRLRTLLARLGTTAVPWASWSPDDPDGWTLVDIDERADLDRKQRDPDLSIGVSREEEPGPKGRRGTGRSGGNRT
jgi:molybdopterin-guanine dinucleotide biosynthesis protein A